jgi:hypothetical protein
MIRIVGAKLWRLVARLQALLSLGGIRANEGRSRRISDRTAFLVSEHRMRHRRLLDSEDSIRIGCRVMMRHGQGADGREREQPGEG